MNSASSPAGHGAPLVDLDNLTVSYRKHPALHHISGVFAQGSLTAVMGPNGSGKSTLLKSIAGLLPVGCDRPAAALQVNLNHRPMAYLPQFSEIDRSFPIDVKDCVLLGLWGRTGPLGGMGAAMLERVDAALHSVGLQGFERRSVGSLSSGQFQRVLFARLLVQDADLILLDEPFNAMDARTTADLLALVQHWHQERRTVIAVLHDEAQVRQHFPQTLLLARERVAWGPTAVVLTPENLQRARAMAEAWDETARVCELDVAPTGPMDPSRTQAPSSTAV
ncbi:MAG: metal ABC transporter ATP-binding protein [Burkholderiaceae bacterium]|nr:metal ABC transporter ATP-binding protein [Burkholderiaceae bacterium]